MVTKNTNEVSQAEAVQCAPHGQRNVANVRMHSADADFRAKRATLHSFFPAPATRLLALLMLRKCPQVIIVTSNRLLEFTRLQLSRDVFSSGSTIAPPEVADLSHSWKLRLRAVSPTAALRPTDAEPLPDNASGGRERREAGEGLAVADVIQKVQQQSGKLEPRRLATLRSLCSQQC